LQDRRNLLDGEALLLHGTSSWPAGRIVPRNSRSGWTEKPGAPHEHPPAVRLPPMLPHGPSRRILRPHGEQSKRGALQRVLLPVRTGLKSKASERVIQADLFVLALNSTKHFCGLTADSQSVLRRRGRPLLASILSHGESGHN